VRLKLLNPLGVGELLSSKYLIAVDEQTRILEQDLATIVEIDHQLAVYQEDVTRDFRLRLADVDNVLYLAGQGFALSSNTEASQALDLVQSLIGCLNELVAGADDHVERAALWRARRYCRCPANAIIVCALRRVPPNGGMVRASTDASGAKVIIFDVTSAGEDPGG